MLWFVQKYKTESIFFQSKINMWNKIVSLRIVTKSHALNGSFTGKWKQEPIFFSNQTKQCVIAFLLIYLLTEISLFFWKCLS